jgi:hypothetical protein
MRRHPILAIAGLLCVSPLLGELLLAQQPAAPAAPAAPRGRSPIIQRRVPKDTGPAPRSASGKILLDGANGKVGLWTPMFGVTDPILEFPKVPFQPWAQALYVARQADELEPHTRCHPSGVARQFLTPYGVEFVEFPELQRIYIFDEGGPHTFREIYMDGRSHPKDLVASYYGHSIGRWEGDTLVVDTVGFNERFWLDRRGLPHTDQMHTLERFTRTGLSGMKYEVTVDDPGAYTAPWTGWFNLNFQPDQELWEYICQQGNYAGELMLGSFKTMDRTTTIVP